MIELDPRVKPLLTVEEVATLLDWRRSTTYAAVKAGALPVFRRGRRTFIVTAHLLAQLGLDGVGNEQPVSVIPEAIDTPTAVREDGSDGAGP